MIRAGPPIAQVYAQILRIRMFRSGYSCVMLLLILSKGTIGFYHPTRDRCCCERSDQLQRFLAHWRDQIWILYEKLQAIFQFSLVFGVKCKPVSIILNKIRRTSAGLGYDDWHAAYHRFID